MNFRNLAADRMMVGFPGNTWNPVLEDLVCRLGVGGVILGKENTADPELIPGLVAEIKDRGIRAQGRPPLVAVDQEGGRVQRIRGAGVPPLPPMEEVGKSWTDSQIFEAGLALSRSLKTLGVDLILAPVLDVVTNDRNAVIGDRSFGPDPRRVAELGETMIRGIIEGGAAACAKHFPGHGAVADDSHLLLPIDSSPREVIEQCHLIPFETAASIPVPAVMTAHILYPVLDDILPATLSRKVITDLLREKMAYNGVVITDDLTMGAIRDSWALPEAASLSLAAGADLCLAVFIDPAEANEMIAAAAQTFASFSDQVRRDSETRLSRLRAAG